MEVMYADYFKYDDCLFVCMCCCIPYYNINKAHISCYGSLKEKAAVGSMKIYTSYRLRICK